MIFTHNSKKDLEIVIEALKRGEPFGLARFGDGEERMYMGGTYHCSDGWVSKPNKNSVYRRKIGDSIRYCHDRYHVGVRAPRGLAVMAWTVNNVRTPPERWCDPCLFVNARWDRARKFFVGFRRHCLLVGSGKGVDFKIPHNCIEPEYKYGKLLKTLLSTKKTILLAAGPLANILVMDYIEAGGQQAIVDIGTVLDYELFGKPTRGYMRAALKKKARKKRRGGKKPKKRPPKRRKK